MAPSLAGKQATGIARWQRLATAALLSAYFLFFARDGLSARWAADDMMNLYGAWKPGPWKLLLSQFTLWRGEYRPMGGAFYAALFPWFGLDPLPYRVAILLILGLNVWLAYRAARLLGCHRIAATIAAAVISYHAGLGALHYNTDVIYDILCFTFYIGALAYYVSIRRRGRLPRAKETVVFFALFLCALNSKEMAVTLPVVLLAYEALYHTPERWNWPQIRAWLFGPGRIALGGAALNLLYIYGKKFGPDPLMNHPAYRPVFSLKRLVEFQTVSTGELFFRNPVSTLGLLALWTALTWLAWREDRPLLRFCWAFMLLAPLPTEFLHGRYQASLYIQLFGWAIFASVIFVDLASGIARFLTRPRFLRGTERIVLAVILALALRSWARLNYRIHGDYIRPAMAGQAPLTAEVIQQFQTLKPRVPPHSQVVFLKDPFPDSDMGFIASLCFGDRSVNVHLQRQSQLP
jgi:hypothetical protein